MSESVGSFPPQGRARQPPHGFAGRRSWGEGMLWLAGYRSGRGGREFNCILIAMFAKKLKIGLPFSKKVLYPVRLRYSVGFRP